MLSPSVPFASGTTLFMARGQSQPRDLHDSRHPGLKRQRSKSHDRSKVQFLAQPFDKKNVVCWSCGKKGHIMKFCRMTSTTSPSVANVAEHLDTEANDLYTDGQLCNSPQVVVDVWILDCACSYHICYIREFFCTFYLSNGSVLMGNDQPCRIEGVESLKIRMFDGVNRTLNQVRFIPNMRKNLISLGVLDSHGLEWSSR